MSELPKDGGPAFDRAPYIARAGELTMRDWFAGQAMAIVAPPQFYMGVNETRDSLKDYAYRAYCIADAMMEARK